MKIVRLCADMLNIGYKHIKWMKWRRARARRDLTVVRGCRKLSECFGTVVWRLKAIVWKVYYDDILVFVIFFTFFKFCNQNSTYDALCPIYITSTVGTIPNDKNNCNKYSSNRRNDANSRIYRRWNWMTWEFLSFSALHMLLCQKCT